MVLKSMSFKGLKFTLSYTHYCTLYQGGREGGRKGGREGEREGERERGREGGRDCYPGKSYVGIVILILIAQFISLRSSTS